MQTQFNGYLGMLFGSGRGNRPAAGGGGRPGKDGGTVSDSGSKGGGSRSGFVGGSGFRNPKMSLYADGADGGIPTVYQSYGSGKGGPFDFSGGGTQSGGGTKNAFQTFFEKPITIGPAGGLETTPGALLGGALGGIKPGNPATEAPPPGSATSSGGGQPNQAEKNATAAAEKEKKEAADKAEKEKKEAGAKKEKEKKEEGRRRKKKRGSMSIQIPRGRCCSRYHHLAQSRPSSIKERGR